jgi:hypothetical protein
VFVITSSGDRNISSVLKKKSLMVRRSSGQSPFYPTCVAFKGLPSERPTLLEHSQNVRPERTINGRDFIYVDFTAVSYSPHDAFKEHVSRVGRGRLGGVLNLEQEIVITSVESGHCHLRCGDNSTVGIQKETPQTGTATFSRPRMPCDGRSPRRSPQFWSALPMLESAYAEACRSNCSPR